jgi:DNA-3-methyladenine glycosylase
VRLARPFYDRPTLEVAKDLLGKVLVHKRRGAVTSGLIVEVEAYIGETDPASHAAPGPTARNQPMYGTPGFSYVYLNYGIHCMMNVVTESHGQPAAILVRALEPLDGVSVMRRRRLRDMKGRRRPSAAALSVNDLCRGPGNLTMAMGITLGENRVDLVGDRLFIEDRGLASGSIAWGPRIGIRVGTDRQWRAYLRDNLAVSALKIVRV